jgi:sigma-E factor negative regulatory protein RseA
MNTNEALSALMDGEDTPDDMDRIICSIDIDNSHIMKWYRYHLLRSVLRKESICVAALNREFSGGVLSRIEPCIFSSHHSKTL